MIKSSTISTYQEALIKAGYNHKLTYQKQDQKKDNWQQRKRQIILLNISPPPPSPPIE